MTAQTATATAAPAAAGTAAASRYERGIALLEKAYGVDATAQTVSYLDTLSPDYSRYLVEAGFADVYGREAIDQRGREVINIIAMASLGGLEGQLQRHIEAALGLGTSPTEIVETLFHLSLIIGHPRANAALAVAKTVFDTLEVNPVPTKAA
ncbi:carboxymuconolactone decarboxylase family protein [Streptomyces sp. TLI_171]|uniref:carboxymuconolactone decarboxylase family protein n=1 Tax=Streptomyces sp. TLI_171 TaxID=1938859 RepID=UPI000C179BC6|nr:carboxymuconolactone decarboxylase family protein [Streptomyces sp. TLI_171]RKE20776.1 4-carboxymuconolactone decarboxylase [Streptomyces sp. TLI_171]